MTAAGQLAAASVIDSGTVTVTVTIVLSLCLASAQQHKFTMAFQHWMACSGQTCTDSGES
jgi:hypothetical protein